MAIVNRGDIRQYQFKEPDKKRPVLILTRDALIPHLNAVTIAPITSTIRDIPSEILLTRQDGMSQDCVIDLDRVQTVPKEKVGKLIATLPAARLAQVKTALLFTLGFDE